MVKAVLFRNFFFAPFPLFCKIMSAICLWLKGRQIADASWKQKNSYFGNKWKRNWKGDVKMTMNRMWGWQIYGDMILTIWQHMRTVKEKKVENWKVSLNHCATKILYTIFVIEGSPQIKCIKKEEKSIYLCPISQAFGTILTSLLLLFIF